VPITARLSKRFYDQFGEETANELVDWMNKVDAVQKSEFRDLLAAHTERIDARFAAMDAKFAAMEARMDAKLEHFRMEMKAEFAAVRAEQVRWLFLAWASLLIPLVGLWTR